MFEFWFAIFVVASIVLPFATWAFVARQRDIRAEREAQAAQAAAQAALPFDEVGASAYVVPASGIVPVAQEVTIENPLPFDCLSQYRPLPFEGEAVEVKGARRRRQG